MAKKETDKAIEVQQQKIKQEEVLSKLKDPELIFHLEKEISKKHILDTKVKLLTLTTASTAYLDPELRKSLALKGNSSAGKDNCIKAVLTLFPPEHSIFLTNATQATMEDDIQNYKIIAYSEINQKKENGANQHIVECLKQMTEGGTSSMKKDIKTGFKTATHNQQEQKTVIYGTTESGEDEELGTRFIIGSVECPPEKIKAVNQNTLKKFAGELKETQEYPWTQIAVNEFLTMNKIVMPYIKELPLEFIDTSNPRSMRDLKRLLSITASIAWWHQHQRKITKDGIISEPFDLLVAIIISKDFFNLTYSGVGDARIDSCIKAINEICEQQGDLFERRVLQNKLGVTLNTIKGYLKAIGEVSIALYHHKEGNQIWYKRYQKGVKKLLIGVNWKELKENLFINKGVNYNEIHCKILEKLDSMCNSIPKANVFEKIDTLELTPSEEKEPTITEEKVLDSDELINHKCYLCDLTPCIGWHKAKPICELCGESMKANGEVIEK